MSDKRFCPVSFPHPAHDSCDGTPFDAMAEIAKLESKVDALMRERDVWKDQCSAYLYEKDDAFAALALAAENEAGLNELLRDAMREKEELPEKCVQVLLTAVMGQSCGLCCDNCNCQGVKYGVDAIRALVREQQNEQQDEDCASTRADNHPSITGG